MPMLQSRETDELTDAVQKTEMRMDVETGQNITERDLDRILLRGILTYVGNPRISIQLWNGNELTPPDAPPVARVKICARRAVFEILRSPSVGFGEGYSKGTIEIHGDVQACLNEIDASIALRQRKATFRPGIRSLLNTVRGNSRRRSRRNVHHHYDIGNDFYRQWLDERMIYTCAYFETPTATLAEAQLAKLDYVCRKLRLEPGQKVVEAGCGWGALAMHMAEHYGVDVLAYNSSAEQVAFAREQVAAKKLDDRVTFIEDDYRAIDEHCDVFVSVGMLEHVGLAHFEELGEIIARSLRPDGIGLLHSIGRSFPNPTDPWIVKHIFPGGHIPSLSEIMRVFEPQQFSIVDVENLRLHYARTCINWLQNFEAVADKITETHGEAFVRMWRLYLAGSAAGFEAGSLQLYQIVFTPAGNNNLPFTRDYLYENRRKGTPD